MKSFLKYILLLILGLQMCTKAQYNNNKFSIGISGVYTTTAKVYLNPNSSDITLKNQFFLLEDIFNPAIDIRYRLTEPLIIGINLEYITKTAMGPNLRVLYGNSIVTINIEEGFKLIPVELSIYYLVPFSTENFKFLMGAGAGYYFGEHIRKFGDVKVKSTELSSAYGIHVSIAMEYMLRDNVGLRTEMKFRDPQFNLKNKYNKEIVNYNGGTITLLQDHFDSKINVDGVTFVLGATFNF
jgi:outer membrane protein W